jgi:ribosomal protein S18 acetylase RimI-like enzyme
MVIRPLVFQDTAKISRLIRCRGIFNEKEIQVAMEVIDETLRYPDKMDYEVFCALDGPDALIGYISFGPIPMTEDYYDIYWIAVDEKFSRKGTGSKLLEFMEGYLIEKGARRVYVETSSTPVYEAARSFYQKHGYRVVSVLTDFYHKGDHKMIYMKELLGVVPAKSETTYSR